MIRIAAIAAMAAAGLPAVASGDTRVVVEKNTRLERLFEANTDCAGFTFTERFSVRRTVTDVYDDAGNLLREILSIHFDGTATNDSTGADIPVDGQRRIVLDFERGTATESGVLRHVTARGEGIVLHDSGRVVSDLETMAAVSQSGPHQLREGDLSGYCAALANA